MVFNLLKISYKDLREQTYVMPDDRYKIAAFLTERVRDCLLACPNNVDEKATVMQLVLDNGIAVGRNLLFTTKFKAGNNEFLSQTGGSVEVYEKYRHRGIASIILGQNNTEYDIYIGALYSQGALAIYRKKGDYLIESPLLIKPYNLEFYLQMKGVNGLALNLLKPIVNVIQKIVCLPALLRKRALHRQYNVDCVRTVPEWAADIACNDTHLFMEKHDVAWLQWCLDYNMSDNPDDTQTFFLITEKKGSTRGFFMTKVRNNEEFGPYRNMKNGTIVEWGSTDENSLTETDILLLAEDSFDNNVTTIITVPQDVAAITKLKRMGYFHRGNYVMSFSDAKNRFPDASDRSKWRIRYGCCNTIILKTSR